MGRKVSSLPLITEVSADVEAVVRKGNLNGRTPISLLKGDKGDTGASAYQLALAAGFVGTEVQWLNSLKVKGDPGDPGEPGEPGQPGEPGEPGAPGETPDLSGYYTKAEIDALLAALGNGSQEPETPTALDPSIQTPSMTFTSLTSYPPELNFDTSNNTLIAGDTVRVEFDDNSNFSSPGFFTFKLTNSAEQISVAPELAAIQAPAETYFRWRVERGASYSSWGKLKHGDVTAPVITTNKSTLTTEGSPLLHEATANENGTWSLEGLDAALLELSTNAGTSTNVRLIGNGNLTHATKSSYSYTLKFTDDAGLTQSVAIIDNVKSLTPVAKLVIGTGDTGSGANRNRNIGSDGHTATMTGSPSSPSHVRVLDAPPLKAHVEIKINATPDATGKVYFGFSESTLALGNGVYPTPGKGSDGVTFFTRLGSTAIGRYVNGVQSDTFYSLGTAAVTVDDVFVLELDQAADEQEANTVVLKRNNTVVGTVVLTSLIPDDWRFFVGGYKLSDSATINCGDSAFAIAPTSGFEGW